MKDSKKKILEEELKLLSFKRILITIEYLVIRPIVNGFVQYLR